MGIKLWLVASILAASFTTVATAQEIDWKKVDDTFGRKARGHRATCTATVFPAPI